MDFFRYLTPITYWLLIVMWAVILWFYIRRLSSPRVESKLFATLIVILSIDAFRTLFESFYFGAWYTSEAGLFPIYIRDFLVRPANVFIPKVVNLVAAVLVIVILLRRWIPNEEEERGRQVAYTKELEGEVAEHLRLQKENEGLIGDLRAALAEVRTLSGLLPMCSGCKKIRDDKGYWNRLEDYISEHTDADFSHGICPDCMVRLYPKQMKKMQEGGASPG